jgi:hypothetical protein
MQRLSQLIETRPSRERLGHGSHWRKAAFVTGWLRARTLLPIALATASCGGVLRSTDPTTTRAEPSTGWLRVDAHSMGLTFAVPADTPAAVMPSDDPDLVSTCQAAARGETPSAAPERTQDTYYRKSVCVHTGEKTFFVAVIVAQSGEEVDMFEQSIGHSAKHADASGERFVSGYPGLEWSKTQKDGFVEHSCGWIAGDRFYLAYAFGKSDDAGLAADTQQFFNSFEVLDRN